LVSSEEARPCGPTLSVVPMSEVTSPANAFSKRVMDEVMARFEQRVDHEGLNKSVVKELREVSRRCWVLPLSEMSQARTPL
jgi:hypothetical protein